MLKITADRDARRLVLEGSLSGPWVDTLEESWRDALARDEARRIVVDLSDVTFVDPRGKALLAAIHKAGATLSAGCCMNSALIQEIERTEQHGAARARSPRSFLWLLAFLIPSLALLSACSSVRAGEPAATDGRPAVAVSVSPVVAGDVTDTVNVVGSLSPKYATDVKSEVSGTVAAVYVTEWVPVRAGARLARLNTAENDAALEAIKAAEAQARVAESRARREYDRALQLREYGLITPQNADDARSALDAAAAAAEAARAQVRAAEARLAKSFITAPMDGVVAFRGVNVGDRVENMGGGGPMFRIVDNRRLDLTVAVPSVHLGAIRVGQALEFTVDALPGRTFTGTVMFINPAVDEASRAAKVIAEVRNTGDALKGGLFVRGRIVVANRAGVLQVPRTALLNWNVAAATADVFVVRDGKAEMRPVQILLTEQAGGTMVAIGGGLASGDHVVTRGGFALKAGDRVTVSGEGM
ncbi:MAG: efflux RND transporter periplasmic adaptor subunit [Acidobacteriia bacterium]|nr:efflux RND transporter periplasmic adaptor subunit [Terriglobia bacterium]